jgi:prepilin-type N-terminal cleavage/methylation domain-containing protein
VSKKNGFTIVELMVVIIVISIISAVAVPMLQGRISSAKWSEGKAMMGGIAVALRAHVSEKGSHFSAVPTLDQLGFAGTDLNGSYFTGGESGDGDFSWIVNSNNPLDFLVTATAPAGVKGPSRITLDHTGKFTEIP